MATAAIRARRGTVATKAGESDTRGSIVDDGAMSERRVDLTMSDGVLDCYVFEPGETRGTDAGPWPAVVMFMDAFAIRPALASMAERLAAHGYVVALPNLYYRSSPFPPFDPQQVAAGGAERERFSGMIKSIDSAMVIRDTAAVIALLDRTPTARPGPIAALGYCMGGGYALSAAGAFPDRVSVAASFHGGSLATASPHSPHLLASRMRAKLYIGIAEIDPSFSPEQRTLLETTFTGAGLDHELEVYPRAKHGFAVTGHLAYDRDASEHHWQRLVELLARTL
jgi:carboxymethylenebutenolidase